MLAGYRVQWGAVAARAVGAYYCDIREVKVSRGASPSMGEDAPLRGPLYPYTNSSRVTISGLSPFSSSRGRYQHNLILGN